MAKNKKSYKWTAGKKYKKPIEGLLCDECYHESLRPHSKTRHGKRRYRCVNPDCTRSHTSRPIKISEHTGEWHTLDAAGDPSSLKAPELKGDTAEVGQPIHEKGKPGMLKTSTEEFEDQGTNHATLEFKSPGQLTTLKQLLEVTETDLDEWEVEKHKINKWDTTIKVPDPKRGKGFFKGEPYPNYQVKADLVRKVPVVQKWPAVQPVGLNPGVAKFPHIKTGKKDTYHVLFIPDSQTGFSRHYETQSLIPFHDRRALDLALQIAILTKPDIIVFLGDMFDFPMYTDKYQRSPDYYYTVQPALEENFYWFYQFAQLGAEMIYLCGNHEQRLYNWTMKHDLETYYVRPANAPKSPRIKSVEHMAGLDDLGIKFIGPWPDAEHWLSPVFCARHGDITRGEAGDSVKAMLKKISHYEVTGHTHHYEIAGDTRPAGPGQIRTIQTMSSGTTSRIDGKVVPAATSRVNWQQAVTEAWFTMDSVNMGGALINEGRTIWHGRQLVSRPMYEIIGDLNTMKPSDYQWTFDITPGADPRPGFEGWMP